MMKSESEDHSGLGGTLLGAGAALLVVACCALVPLLAAGGVIAAIGAFVCNPWVIGVGVVLLGLGIYAFFRMRGNRTGARREHDCCATPDASDRQDR